MHAGHQMLHAFRQVVRLNLFISRAKEMRNELDVMRKQLGASLGAKGLPIVLELPESAT